MRRGKHFRLDVHRPDVTRGEVDAEIQAHLEQRIEALVRSGLSPEAARAEAERRFGIPDQARDRLQQTAGQRERVRRLREWIDALFQDLRYAARGLRREPLFTAFVVATLGLGIGANAAMFGIVDRLLVRGPEHIVDPGRVLRVYQRITQPGYGEFSHPSFGYVSYDLLKHTTHSFDGVAAYTVNPANLTLGKGSEAQQLDTGIASADLFPLLGVQPAAGRFFTAEEDRPGAAQPVVVLGWGLWQSAFGGDRTIVGKPITLSEQQYTVVGVAPRGFTGPGFGRVDVWIPLSFRSVNVTRDWTHTWNAQWHRIIARLEPEVSLAEANADATAAYRRGYTGTDSAEVKSHLFRAPLTYNGSGRETAEISISRWLVGVSAIVLLIAVSNVVNLLLARALRRRREVAVRMALGSGRRRLVRLLCTESVLLAGLGGAAGLGLALVGGRLIRRLLLPSIEWPDSPADFRVLVVTPAVALSIGILAGLVPALRASRPDLADALKAGTREGGGQRSRLRAGLTIAQAALSVLLLVGAGLFVKSLARVRALDLGLEPERVLVVSPRWPRTPRGDTAAARLAREHQTALLFEAEQAARALPGIEHTSRALGLAFQSSFSQFLRVPGWDSLPIEKGGAPHIAAVGSEYFETVGTPILRGRGFGPEDRAGSEPVSIVNQNMAETLWPGANPLGQCLFTGDSQQSATRCFRIVGVVGNSRRFELQEPAGMQYYIPLGQEQGFCCASLLVRPRGKAAESIAAVRSLLTRLDPGISFVSVQVMQEAVDPQIRPWRLGASMFSLMGVLALVVAALGLYSVMSYLVAQRTHELGVRIALGAPGRAIVASVVRDSLGFAAAGAAIGLGLALWAGRFVAPLLFQTSPRDPLVLAGVVGVLLATGLLASLLPALRARRVDPMEALREE